MIKITITGAPAEGKTTISIIVEQALRDAGFLVTNTDADVRYGGAHLARFQDRRVEKICGRSVILIETGQVKR